MPCRDQCLAVCKASTPPLPSPCGPGKSVTLQKIGERSDDTRFCGFGSRVELMTDNGPRDRRVWGSKFSVSVVSLGPKGLGVWYLWFRGLLVAHNDARDPRI